MGRDISNEQGFLTMPTPDSIFSIAGTIALACWIALGVSLFSERLCTSIWRMTSMFVPALFAAAYIVLIHQGFAESPSGGFGSINEVRALFASNSALVAGWLHYLAFDLFVGSWIVRTGLDERVPRILVLVCLPLTFMFGPVGLLAFLAVRVATPHFRHERDAA